MQHERCVIVGILGYILFLAICCDAIPGVAAKLFCNAGMADKTANEYTCLMTIMNCFYTTIKIGTLIIKSTILHVI